MIAGTVFSIGIFVVGRESEFLFQRSIIAGYFDRFLASELDIAVTALTEKVDNVFLGKPLVAHPEGDVLGFRCDAAPRHFVNLSLEFGLQPVIVSVGHGLRAFRHFFVDIARAISIHGHEAAFRGDGDAFTFRDVTKRSYLGIALVEFLHIFKPNILLPFADEKVDDNVVRICRVIRLPFF